MFSSKNIYNIEDITQTQSKNGDVLLAEARKWLKILSPKYFNNNLQSLEEDYPMHANALVLDTATKEMNIETPSSSFIIQKQLATSSFNNKNDDFDDYTSEPDLDSYSSLFTQADTLNPPSDDESTLSIIEDFALLDFNTPDLPTIERELAALDLEDLEPPTKRRKFR